MRFRFEKFSRIAIAITTVAALLFSGCSHFSRKPKKIAVSPAWDGIEAASKRSELTGFTFEVISAMSQEEHAHLNRTIASSETLLVNLKDGVYDAAFSTLPMTEKNQTLYAFSDPILEVGSVLVVPKDSNIKVIHALAGKRVGVRMDSQDILKLQHVAGIIYENYIDIASAFEELHEGKLEALIVGRLTAKAYLESLYGDKFRILEQPVSEEAIRLIAPVRRSDLIEKFNSSLKKLKRSGEIKRLREKWDV